jgi:hypothetical protein
MKWYGEVGMGPIERMGPMRDGTVDQRAAATFEWNFGEIIRLLFCGSPVKRGRLRELKKLI